jgi:multidrug transporter EmrE-like cation transporter
MSYVYILGTVLLTVYGQLIIKWQVVEAGSFPHSFLGKALFLGNLLLNPWIISALLAALLAALFWMAAMTKLQLSHAYPMVSLSFALVVLLSGAFFGEPIGWLKISGIVLITCGVIVGSQG